MRKAGVAALLVVGTLVWTLFGFGLWAERQALDTEEWVDTSGALLESEPIRTAVGLYIADQLFQSAEVEARLEEALPPRLDSLAAPAAAGLEEVARRNAPRLLGNALALQAWERANEAAHSRLLDILEGRLVEADVSLDLRSLFGQVAESVGLPAGVADRLPPEVASLQVAEPEQLETARDALDLFKTLVWVLVAVAIAAFAGAVALSRDRRRTLVAVGGCLMFAAVAILAVRRLAGEAIVDALAEAPNAMSAADDAWDIGTSLLVDAAQGSFLLGLFMVTGAWLAGAGRRATAVRRTSAYAMREHPGLVRAGLGMVILLLIVWGPVPWTQRFWPIVAFTVAAFVWLEWVRAAPWRSSLSSRRRGSRRACPGAVAGAARSSSGLRRCATRACSTRLNSNVRRRRSLRAGDHQVRGAGARTHRGELHGEARAADPSNLTKRSKTDVH